MNRVPLVCLAAFLLHGTGWGVEPLKVVFASRVDTAPVIDGVLNDECWKRAEVRSDFVTPTEDTALKRTSTMRFVYDDQCLYLGLEFFWDDIQILKDGVAGMIRKHGPPQSGICAFKNYSNSYGVELFMDPGATRLNYYQILFNAAGQYTGNYKAMWHCFKEVHKVKSSIGVDRWTAELAYTSRNLKEGEEWGLNVCRNDESYYSIWNPTTNYHDATRFGRIVMGSYSQWWESVWTRGAVRRLSEIRKNISRYPELKNLDGRVESEAGKMAGLAEKHPPQTRENLEILYRAYSEFKRDFQRLSTAYATSVLCAEARKGSPR